MQEMNTLGVWWGELSTACQEPAQNNKKNLASAEIFPKIRALEPVWRLTLASDLR